MVEIKWLHTHNNNIETHTQIHNFLGNQENLEDLIQKINNLSKQTNNNYQN